MKKLFGILIIIFLFSSVVYAGSKLIERDTIGRAFSVRTICVDGYKFVTTRDTDMNATSVSIVQFYVSKKDKVIPATCN